LAEVQTIAADPVAGLIDIPLPRQVSLWPQTWPLRITIVILLAVIVVALWRSLHWRRVNKYRREALAELNRMERTFDVDQVSAEFVDGLSVLVRRTALAAFPRETVAPLTGPAWLAFLDRTSGGREFSQGPGRLLASLPYQGATPGCAEISSLTGLIRNWIRNHHV
jgi:hypothetical protein